MIKYIITPKANKPYAHKIAKFKFLYFQNGKETDVKATQYKTVCNQTLLKHKFSNQTKFYLCFGTLPFRELKNNIIPQTIQSKNALIAKLSKNQEISLCPVCFAKKDEELC